MNAKPLKVIKVGGNEFSRAGFSEKFARVMHAQQGQYACILVHGGGKAVSKMMQALHIEPEFIDGQRVTDQAALEVAEMVLSGRINKQIVFAFVSAGLDALGMSGVDRRLLQVQPWGNGMGRVGRITHVRAEVLLDCCAQDVIPVISPIAVGPAGTYNVNADHAAGMIAGAVHADAAIFITDVPGVLLNGEIIPQLSAGEIQAHIQNGGIAGGMIPKVQAALAALDVGAGRAVITNLDGFTCDSGTHITLS